MIKAFILIGATALAGCVDAAPAAGVQGDSAMSSPRLEEAADLAGLWAAEDADCILSLGAEPAAGLPGAEAFSLQLRGDCGRLAEARAWRPVPEGFALIGADGHTLGVFERLADGRVASSRLAVELRREG